MLRANQRLIVGTLADRYGTSSNPVREALQQLRGEGFVIFAANRGGYGDTAATTLSPVTVANNGGSQPHENRPPFLVISMCIALQGIFPSPN